MTYFSSQFKLDPQALHVNVGRLRQSAPHSEIIAMVKANAYGHGVGHFVALGKKEGIRTYGVVTLNEGIELRKLDKDIKIILWGMVPSSFFQTLSTYRLVPVIGSVSQWKEWVQWCCAQNVQADFHLEFDTGIARSGIRPEDFQASLHEKWVTACLPEAVASHFVESECERSLNVTQRKLFSEMRKALSQKCEVDFKCHISNSGSLLMNQVTDDETWVRPGIALYGYGPTLQLGKDLQPVGTFQARVVDLKEIHAGEGVSYNHRFMAKRESRIATLGAGYADGVPRYLSGKAAFSWKGFSVPQIGTVCMDVTCVDVTDVEGIRVGEWVTLFGKNKELYRWAEECNTIAYELLCHLGPRVNRDVLEV